MFIELHDSFLSHRKVRRLAERLGVSVLETRGVLVTLWLGVAKLEPDGCLRGWDKTDIEHLVGWSGAHDLVDALVAERLLGVATYREVCTTKAHENTEEFRNLDKIGCENIENTYSDESDSASLTLQSTVNIDKTREVDKIAYENIENPDSDRVETRVLKKFDEVCTTQVPGTTRYLKKLDKIAYENVDLDKIAYENTVSCEDTSFFFVHNWNRYTKYLPGSKKSRNLETEKPNNINTSSICTNMQMSKNSEPNLTQPNQTKYKTMSNSRSTSLSRRLAAAELPGCDSGLHQVLKYYLSHWPRRRRQTEMPKVRRQITSLLKSGYTPELLCQAIDGNKASPFHVRNGHTSLSLIFRAPDYTDRFIGYATTPPEDETKTHRDRNLQACLASIENDLRADGQG